MRRVLPPAELPLRDRPLSRLPRVGAEREALLARLDIHFVEDLLLHKPSRYEDRRSLRPIAELREREPSVTHGRVVACGLKYFAQRTKSVYEVILSDGSARLHCRWWNMSYLEGQFAVGDEVVVFGKLIRLKPRTMDHPETEIIETGDEEFLHLGRITPVYPLTQGISQRWLRGLIWRTFDAVQSQIQEPFPDAAPMIAKLKFPSRVEAIRMLHSPSNDEEPKLARSRLALDEFLELQIAIQSRRAQFFRKVQALPCGGDNRLIKPFLANLGFVLTEAQKAVLRQMRKDLSGTKPMRRLLQGDVGSGKTVVAACCALMAIECRYATAIMAPTEILAEQHFQTFKRWFNPLGIAVEIRTGSHRERSPASSESEGRGILFIGTHALLTEGVDLPNLGLVIIDEQHRFGVAQRERLIRKGPYPHLLVMTATPIPRTLGLTLYGDLDVSVLNQLPPGRGRIDTFVRTPESFGKVVEFVRGKLTAGQQAYIVYPRVEETGGAAGVKAVVREFETMQKLFAPHPVGLLHGRLAPREKDAAMASFRSGGTKVLLATSLIEVGVDVPNATVMVIENADQFGLAQLHQLRGRIGRGAQHSYCILIGPSSSVQACERLKVLEQTTDGFQIAEADLRLRGPGELLGQAQSGMPRFRFGDFKTDAELIMTARRMASELVSADQLANGANT